MIVFSRRIGQTFYIQPLIGDLLIVKVLAVFIKNSVEVMVRLCIQRKAMQKIAPRIKKSFSNVSIRIKRSKFSLLNATSDTSIQIKTSPNANHLPVQPTSTELDPLNQQPNPTDEENAPCLF
jgi:hypothetical protein